MPAAVMAAEPDRSDRGRTHRVRRSAYPPLIGSRAVTSQARSVRGHANRSTAVVLRSLRSAMAPVVLVVLAAAWAVPTATPAAAATPRTRAAGWARPHVGTPAGWTETWSTGPLAQYDLGQPIALSSPIEANLDGQPSVVVGDRSDHVYAYHLATPTSAGSPPVPTSVAGWPTTNESGPIDSTPSVADGNGTPEVLVGSGNDTDATTGGYQAFGANGDQQWFTPVINPSTDTQPDIGVQAGLAVGTLQGGNDAFAGSLGQVSYALNAANGAPLTGWPFFNSDSTHSTAALADLYGTGQNQIIVGSDQTAGLARAQRYTDGGHLRILTAQGNQICRADTGQVVDSSPAVGDFLPGGVPGIVVGTGAYYPGAPDTDALLAYDGKCNLLWATQLDGSTYSSPALSDVLGNGSLQVVEGTDQGLYASGSVYVLNATTGQVIWKQSDIGRVIGSVVTADLGGGYDDVIVPTINGALVFDGRSGTEIADLSPTLGLQNSPLVTRDPNGTIGITLAGYVASDQSSNGVGEIDHYEIDGSNGALAVGAGAWPMFHHDPELTGNVSGPTRPGVVAPCSVPAAALPGYLMAASDGGIFTFGGRPFCGSTGGLRLNAPVVGLAMSPDTGGYWEVASDGGIFAFGGARFYGSEGGRKLNAPIVGMAATPDGKGYWEVASDGGIFAFGDARFLGSEGGRKLNAPIVGLAATADGNGYRLVAADGGIFSFGDAPFSGSVGGQKLNKPVVGAVNDTNTGGYWEVASDGGIFTFGGAPFLGSTGSLRLNAPIVGMAETANGSGYRFVAADGGVFTGGSAAFFGSEGGRRLNKPIVGLAGF